ncbi:uncharacterized protein LOC141850476 [Brevipalpus obovatus]|uniref:uncharacterized protein LOC141850476 n=1 Tax=Brevipalpus obovatus TaxID=246614 RepID=UPI003D9F706C
MQMSQCMTELNNSIPESSCQEYLLVVDKTRSVQISGGGRKRKDSKFCSSPVVRSSSEERKKMTETSSTDDDGDVRRCFSYQNFFHGDLDANSGDSSDNLHHHQHRPHHSAASSTTSACHSPQPPEAKRREIESSKSPSSYHDSSMSLESSRPSSLELSSQHTKSIDSETSTEQHLDKTTYLAIKDDNLSASLSSSSISPSSSNRILHAHNSKVTSLSSPSLSSIVVDDQRKSHGIDRTDENEHEKSPNNDDDSDYCKENTNYSSSLPLIDLNALHRNADGEAAVVSESRYSWSLTSESLSSESLNDEDFSDNYYLGDGNTTGGGDVDLEDDGKLSSSTNPRLAKSSSIGSGVPNAAMHMLKRHNTYEAPLSPSAYRGSLGQRAAHLDHTIPPSPPGEQEHHFRGNRSSYNHDSRVIKDTKKKIHVLKRRLKQFESEFERENDYRPSYEQKMKSTIAKPILIELGKYRKILRELKDDSRLERTTEFYANIFSEMQKTLQARRCIVGRPETIENMNADQIFAEKLDLQKSLLKYESLFGRPTKREDKAVMKPLYDRYRTIRNLVAKIPKSKDSTDLQPILEHVAMNFSSPSHSPQSSIDKGNPIGEEDEAEEKFYNTKAIDDSNNAQDSYNENSSSNCDEDQNNNAETSKSYVGSVSNPCNQGSADSSSSELNVCYNLHALSFSELVKELHQTSREKQELRETIKAFEESQRAHGRKIDRETKSQIESTYSNYKALKKKLRLLEALITKYEKKSE